MVKNRRGAFRRNNARRMKRYTGIDYTAAPESYWDDMDPLSAILRNVKGERRRELVRTFWAAGKLEELDSALLSDELDNESRTRFGRIHPTCLGGEYLPSYRAGEVEVARITLESTTSDV